MSEQTIKIPLEKGKTVTVTGQVAIIPIGDKKVRFLIHRSIHTTVSGYSLTHVESGRRFGDISPAIVPPNVTPPSLRDRAVDLVEYRVTSHGADKVLQIIESQQVIN